MKRYPLFVVLLLLVAATSVACIWLFAPTDQHYKQLDLTLKVAAAVGTVSAIFVALAGLAKSRKAGEEANAPPVGPSPAPSTSQRSLEDREAVNTYLANLEKILTENSVPRTKYIDLSTEIGQDPNNEEFEILQNFEWPHEENEAGFWKTTRELIALDVAQKRFARFVLLGDPGAGKTASLHHLARTLIEDYRGGRSTTLPFFASFSLWTDVRIDALTFLQTCFSRIAGAASPLAGRLQTLLANGNMVVMLDGLNEMPGRRHREDKTAVAPIQQELLEQLSSGAGLSRRQDPRERSLRELAAVSAVRSQFIVSCRTHEFFQSPSWQEIHVLPMDNEQIQRFIGKYLPPAQAKVLAGSLEKMPALRSLAQNPFFLRSMTVLQSSTLSLVENKGQFLRCLYEELLKREASRGAPIQTKRITKVMALLAYRMIKRDSIGSQVDLRPFVKTESLTPLLATGLLRAKADGTIVFYHQLVQEFLAALALREGWARPRLSVLLLEKKWIEVLVLWHNIASNAHALTSRLIRKLQQRNIPFRKPRTTLIAYDLFFTFIYNVFASLATLIVLDILAGGGWAFSLVKEHAWVCAVCILVLPLLTRSLWRLWYYNRTVIGNAALVISRLANPIAIEPLIAAFKKAPGMSTASCRKEIAEALAGFGAVAVPRLISELSSPNMAQKLGCIQTLGIIGDGRAATPLRGLLNQGDIKLLATTIQALAKIGGPEAAIGIADAITQIKSLGLWGATMLAAPVKASLQQFRSLDNELVNTFKRAAAKTNPHFRRTIAIHALGACGDPEAVPLLEQIARDSTEQYDLRQAAVTGISLMRGPDGALALLRLHEQTNGLRETIVTAIGSLQSPDALQILQTTLDLNDTRLRCAAVRSISLISTPKAAAQLLLKASKDGATEVREEVVWALARKHSAEGAEVLVDLCKDKSEEVRAAALEGLDYACPDVAKTMLMSLATDPCYADREKAIDLLGNYRFPEVRKLLSLLCADQNDSVRQRAADSLTRIDSSLEAELKYIRVPGNRNMPRRLLRVLGRLLGTEDLYRLVREEKMAGASRTDSWVKVMGKIQTDAELKRRFRLITSLLLAGIAFAFTFLPGIAIALSVRVLALLGILLWKAKWFVIGFLATAGASFLPAVGARVKRGYPRRALWTARAAGLLTVIVCLATLVVAFWWVGIILVLLLAVGIWQLYKEFREKWPPEAAPKT
jgi:HEAT repeat protein